MELPNKFAAYVPIEKITDYLLSDSHTVGKSKAKFFRSVGFGEINVSQFEKNILDIAPYWNCLGKQRNTVWHEIRC